VLLASIWRQGQVVGLASPPASSHFGTVIVSSKERITPEVTSTVGRRWSSARGVVDLLRVLLDCGPGSLFG
jgi:hypothetical protein